MAAGLCMKSRVSAAMIAVTAMLWPWVPGRADPGCDLGDIVNAFINAASSIGSACPGVCEDGVGCAAAAALAAGLGGVGASGNQGSVDNFCNNVNNLQNNIASIQNALGDAGIALDLSQILGSVGNPLSIAQCACDAEEGVGQLGSDVGACFQELGQAICQAMNLGTPCSCTPSAPVLADCGQNISTLCEQYTSDTTCFGADSQGTSTIVQGYDPTSQTIQNISPYYPAQQTQTSGGTLVSVADQYCGGLSYCFCPKPMVPTWTYDYPQNLDNPNNCMACENHSSWYIFSCNCPSGTHPDPSGKLVNGISVCLCDNTNQPADFNPQSFFGMCPPPACPTGQVRLSGNGNCVTPCSDPTKGMTMDGTCCDPSQVTACGQCCPAKTIPDPATGTCIPIQTAQ